jgi:hypothetical protein
MEVGPFRGVPSPTVATAALPQEASPPPSRPAREKLRVQLDLDEAAVEELDQIKDIMGAVSRAEVVRLALLWVRWTMLQLSDGKSLLLAKDGKQLGVVFFPLLGIKRK